MNIFKNLSAKNLSSFIFNKPKKEFESYESIVTKSGFMGSLKWNGKWFNDETDGLIHLILPNDIELKVAKQFIKTMGISLSKPRKSFIKMHTEGNFTYNSGSWVISIPLNNYSEYANSIQEFLTSTKIHSLLVAIEQKCLFVESAI